jgi:hypothetical protein
LSHEFGLPKGGARDRNVSPATKQNLVYWFDNLGNLTAMGDRSAGYTLGGTGQTAHSYAYCDLAGPVRQV